MNEVWGYIAFTLIGFILGVIGGGGSMLAVPVLVYCMGMSAGIATAYSLFIVGITSLLGSFNCIRKGEFNLEAIYLFAIPSIISIFCTRKFLMPAMPDVIFSAGSFTISKDALILIAFGILVLFSSYSMIKKRNNASREDLMWSEFFKTPLKIPFIVLLGVAVGFISGFVGAGGGFMIIPVLVIFLRMPIKKAVTTSLIIIAINSLIGFTGTIGTVEIDWKLLLIFSALATGGIVIGRYIEDFIPSKKLKPAFGWFAASLGVFILINELIIKEIK